MSVVWTLQPSKLVLQSRKIYILPKEFLPFIERRQIQQQSKQLIRKINHYNQEKRNLRWVFFIWMNFLYIFHTYQLKKVFLFVQWNEHGRSWSWSKFGKERDRREKRWRRWRCGRKHKRVPSYWYESALDEAVDSERSPGKHCDWKYLQHHSHEAEPHNGDGS